MYSIEYRLKNHCIHSFYFRFTQRPNFIGIGVVTNATLKLTPTTTNEKSSFWSPALQDGQHQVRLIIGIMRHLLLLRTETEEKTEEAHRLNLSYSTMLLETCPSRTSINTGLFLSTFKPS